MTNQYEWTAPHGQVASSDAGAMSYGAGGSVASSFTLSDPAYRAPYLPSPYFDHAPAVTGPTGGLPVVSLEPARWAMRDQVAPATGGATAAIMPPMSSRDGAVGVTVGLVLLAATLSGSVFLGLFGNTPAAAPPAATAAATATPTATTAPAPAAGDTAAADAAAGAAPDAAAADASGAAAGAAPDAAAADASGAGAAGANPGAGSAKPAPAKAAKAAPAAGSATSNLPVKKAAPAAKRTAALKPAGSTAGGGGHTTHKPAPKTAPQAAAPAAPAPTPQAAPSTKEPVGYTVSTPGGAKWDIPADQKDVQAPQLPAGSQFTPKY